MTGLERNGDLVRLVSYAPLLGKQRRLQWEPDLIYFDNVSIYLTINYYGQQLFGIHSGDQYLPIAISTNDEAIAESCVQDSPTGDIILKLVSRADEPLPVQITLSGAPAAESSAACTVLSGQPLDENSYSFWQTRVNTPRTKVIEVAPQFSYKLPPHSFSVIRFKSLPSA